MLVDLYYGNADWKIFMLCILITSFFGGTLILTNSGIKGFAITIKQAFLITFLSWLIMATFAALPFWFSELQLSFTDSFFEAMSGIITMAGWYWYYYYGLISASVPEGRWNAAIQNRILRE
jgi:trk system potassium uptake protein TrkH